MWHYFITRQLHNVNWLHDVNVILLLCPFVHYQHILHTAVTNLHCVSVENFYVAYETLENVC